MAQTSKMMCAFLLCSMAGNAHSSEPSVKTLRGFRQNDSLENRSKATGNDILEDEYLQDFNESQLGLQELSATSESTTISSIITHIPGPQPRTYQVRTQPVAVLHPVPTSSGRTSTAQTSKMTCAFLLCSMAGNAHSSEPSVKSLRGFRQNSSLENQSNATGNDTLEDKYLQDFNQSQLSQLELGLAELSETSGSYHDHHHHHHHHGSQPW
eukprot:CAMPEP_0197703262 /NCGR_PEP_ID=MMETSP1338-20131121/125346_1 /TAXON_ID=43686 ORGANISM="Pelagodinium beii, Strain RCC1491" /NCGR_SAMPLE_ID=MMETSP1338 /ASSEMBLY_ACC=CAM_ASM_000754 /LENGTH=210 /DNA_ID=CAMNT_0043287155 /DNA_START=66 /DNA_END=696 /DNA_ORIENTATION=+